MVTRGSVLVPQPGSPPNPLLLGFYDDVIHRRDRLNRWPLVIELNLQTSYSEVSGIRLTVLTLSTPVLFSWQPAQILIWKSKVILLT